MRFQVPAKIYWWTYAAVFFSFIALLAFYISMAYTKQEVPKDVVVWLERLFTVFLGIVYTPHDGDSSGKEAPPPGPDTAPPPDAGGPV